MRQGLVTDEITTTLHDRVIDVSVQEKYRELQESKLAPVCLFPTRKQCDAINMQMLGLLDSEVHIIACTDEMDETKSTAKWNQKTAKALEKLNKDSSNTAGLEAVLRVAVGARVMLRRNIDVKGGLVNGAIGTVEEGQSNRISIKFDHLSEPCDMKKMSGKFLVMRNCYIQRTLQRTATHSALLHTAPLFWPMQYQYTNVKASHWTVHLWIYRKGCLLMAWHMLRFLGCDRWKGCI